MLLSEINERVRSDPRGFIEETDAVYAKKVERAANAVAGHMKTGRLVFLSGPSGSGKTTTAKKLEHALLSRGIQTHVISMDEYYLDESQTAHMLNEAGQRDYESPECLDLPLLRLHYDALSRGEEIMVPRFNFKENQRNPGRAKPLRLGSDEIAIFEGIHALNPALSGQSGSRAFKLYVSTRTGVRDGSGVFFKHTLLRLLRRAVRDSQFRAAGIDKTLSMWDGVRRGELKYISPYKDLADLQFDTAHDYEAPALKPYALPMFESWQTDKSLGRWKDFITVADKLKQFETLDTALIPTSSLLREFLGGGDYKY
jgi:uridine kinase